MNATKYEVEGAEKAAEEARILIERSQWFQVTPMPDGIYEFAVKDGEARQS